MQNNNIPCPNHQGRTAMYYCKEESCKERRIHCLECQKEFKHLSHPNKLALIENISLFLEESQLNCQDLLQFIEKSFEEILEFKSYLISTIKMKYLISIEQFNNMGFQSKCQAIDILLNSEKILKAIRKIIDYPFNSILEQIKGSIKELKLEEITYLEQTNIQNNNQQFESLFNQSQQLFQQNQLNQALEKIDRALFIDPRKVIALNLKGEILMQKEDLQEAQQQFNLALTVDNTNIHTLNGLAECYMKLGQNVEAIQLCCKVFEIDSNNTRAQILISLLVP